MKRPTQEQEVEFALEWFKNSAGGPGGVLSAEVKRLREEQKHWHDQLVSAQSECRELREDIDNLRTIAMERKATIERVEELVPAWRAESKLLRRNHDDDVSLCIADLEAALKGGE